MRMMETTFFKALSLSWLTGPIFAKELRISSRRKRNYVLRVGYLFIFLLVLILIWAEEVGSHNTTTVYQVSRSSQVGLVITGIITIIQFCAAQITVVVMLSNSISDEVSNKTLGVLMSTPISAVQIVAGKMLSKLLQITLLLCLTLPILGIVRVFGGVPWMFLVQSLCLTLTAVFFVGILTLNMSIHHKHAFSVITQAILTLVMLYILLPFFLGWLANQQFGIHENTIFQGVMITNPLFMSYVLLVELFSPRGIPFGTNVWGWTCLVMLTASSILFLRAVLVVRRKALLQACGQLNRGSSKKASSLPKAVKIRHIKGQPLLWKELRAPTFDMGRIKKGASIFLIAGSILTSYYIFGREHFLREKGCHIMYTMIFSVLATFFTATFAATTIASERSGRTWPVLLGTLVTDRQIITAKMIGALRRSAPFWGILFSHLLIFTGMYIHPAAWPHMTMVVFSLLFFTAASGILFSTLLKHTTAAVVVNLIFAVVMWGGIPILTSIIDSIVHMNGNLIEWVITANPFFQLGCIMDAASGSSAVSKFWSQLSYDWTGEMMNFTETTLLLAVIGLIYMAAGFVFLWIAKTRLRKNIF